MGPKEDLLRCHFIVLLDTPPPDHTAAASIILRKHMLRRSINLHPLSEDAEQIKDFETSRLQICSRLELPMKGKTGPESQNALEVVAFLRVHGTMIRANAAVIVSNRVDFCRRINLWGSWPQIPTILLPCAL